MSNSFVIERAGTAAVSVVCSPYSSSFLRLAITKYEGRDPDGYSVFLSLTLGKQNANSTLLQCNTLSWLMRTSPATTRPTEAATPHALALASETYQETQPPTDCAFFQIPPGIQQPFHQTCCQASDGFTVRIQETAQSAFVRQDPNNSISRHLHFRARVTHYISSQNETEERQRVK
ncbi:hypothetical protein M0657_007569 [Pyricularia oryzae]|nr:hypothetical protein M9X92_008616 [Pyricularia oryzae]KAI7918448.1 hypothetical protein M0657_007569 [Pyricularia oryzae]